MPAFRRAHLHNGRHTDMGLISLINTASSPHICHHLWRHLVARPILEITYFGLVYLDTKTRVLVVLVVLVVVVVAAVVVIVESLAVVVSNVEWKYIKLKLFRSV